jgi:hypothetical protein
VKDRPDPSDFRQRTTTTDPKRTAAAQAFDEPEDDEPQARRGRERNTAPSKNRSSKK